MKPVTVAEVKNKLSEYLKRAEKEDVVITRSGKPTAVLHHLGEDELEDYLLKHDPKFKAKVERRWRSYLKHGGVEIEEIVRRERAR
jgi:antitoxin (DNA-binding transcriptional repressor) of toxin-antitoxin stability system